MNDIYLKKSFMKKYDLSSDDIKKLQVFSMYIQSYGSKVARTSIEVNDMERYDDEIWGWIGDNSRITIPSYDDITRLIIGIIDDEDLISESFDYDERGNITAIVNSDNKSLTFSVDRYTMREDPVSDTIESEDISQNVLEWMRQMRESESYKNGQIDYSGGGDDGYMESNMFVNGDSGYSYPENVGDWIVNKISALGDWYNNEGGQGSVYIDFINETISIEGGINYETEVTDKVDYYASFK